MENNSSNLYNEFKKTIFLLKNIESSYILRIFTIFEDNTDIYAVTEQIPNKTLLSELANITALRKKDKAHRDSVCFYFSNNLINNIVYYEINFFHSLFGESLHILFQALKFFILLVFWFLYFHLILYLLVEKIIINYVC